MLTSYGVKMKTHNTLCVILWRWSRVIPEQWVFFSSWWMVESQGEVAGSPSRFISYLPLQPGICSCVLEGEGGRSAHGQPFPASAEHYNGLGGLVVHFVYNLMLGVKKPCKERRERKRPHPFFSVQIRLFSGLSFHCHGSNSFHWFAQPQPHRLVKWAFNVCLYSRIGHFSLRGQIIWSQGVGGQPAAPLSTAAPHFSSKYFFFPKGSMDIKHAEEKWGPGKEERTHPFPTGLWVMCHCLFVMVGCHMTTLVVLSPFGIPTGSSFFLFVFLSV